MPSLRERIEKKLEECEKELKTYGDKVKDPHGTFFRIIESFTKSYKRACKQGIPFEDFHGGLRDLYVTKNFCLLRIFLFVIIYIH